MSEEQEQRDYEALNAATALELNKMKQEIERLKAENKQLHADYWTQNECIANQHDKIRHMKAVVDAAKKMTRYADLMPSLDDPELLKADQELDAALAVYEESI